MGKVFCCFTLLLAFFLGGCSVPRAIHMEALAHDEFHMPPESRRLSHGVRPILPEPLVGDTLETTMAMKDVADWYTSDLTARGWNVPPGWIPIASNDYIHIAFERDVDWVKYFGSLKPEHQTIAIDITRRPSQNITAINIYAYCRADYIWDIPTQEAAKALASVLGPESAPYIVLLFWPF